MKPIRLEDEASDELSHAATWYEQRQPGLGRRYLQAVDATFQQISRIPRAGAPMPRVPAALGVRRVPVKGFPYIVVFLETADAVRVLAIPHDRRRPGYWLPRV